MLAIITTLYDYNRWANQKVQEAASQVGQQDFKASAGLSHDSLCGTLAHILTAETVWRQRCQFGVSPPHLLTGDDFRDLESLRQKWLAEMDAWQAYIGGLSEADLQATVHYHTTRGAEHHDTLWPLLLHVVNHGTQFRSEAAVALTRLGHSPGDLDLLALLRSKQARN